MSTSASGESKAQLGLPSCRWLARQKAASAESVAGRVSGVWALLLRWDAGEKPIVLPMAVRCWYCDCHSLYERQQARQASEVAAAHATSYQ